MCPWPLFIRTLNGGLKMAHFLVLLICSDGGRKKTVFIARKPNAMPYIDGHEQKISCYLLLNKKKVIPHCG